MFEPIRIPAPEALQDIRLQLAAHFTEARIRNTGHCEVAFADHAVRLADALIKAAQE